MAVANSKKTPVTPTPGVMAEALKEKIVFSFRNNSFTIPPAKEWDVDVARAQERGQVVTALESLLGDAQMTKLLKLGRKMGDIEEFLIAMYDAVDTDPKDSAGS